MPYAEVPYNFVPLPDDVYLCPHENGTLSGWLEVELEALTPLYVRAGVVPRLACECDPPGVVWRDWDGEANGAKGYCEFFHHGDPARPVIPGSTLRGLLRAMVVILADGALSTAPRGRVVYRAFREPPHVRTAVRLSYQGRFTPDDPTPGATQYPAYRGARTVRAGYLARDDDGQWVIVPALHLGSASTGFIRVEKDHTGAPQLRPVHVQPAGPTAHGNLVYARSDRRPGWDDVPGGWVRAVQVSTGGARDPVLGPPAGDAGKFMDPAVFLPDLGGAILKIPQEVVRAYERDRDQPRSAGHAGRRTFGADPPKLSKVKVGDPQMTDLVPCFYLEDNGEIKGFGPTLFFRIPYEHPPSAFAGRQLNETEDDLATRLFGRLDGPTPRSRVRVGSLHYESGPGPGPYVSPPPLLAPKPAAVQLYLRQAANAAAAYYRTYHDDPTTTVTRLAGVKLYRHAPLTSADLGRPPFADPTRVDAGDRKTRTVIRPVGDGTRFVGRISFDRLTKVELGALLTAVDPRPPRSGTYAHKLGMGRPLGLGSVRLTVRSVHLVQEKERYERFLAEDGRLAAGEIVDDTSFRDDFETAMNRHRGHSRPGFWADERMGVLATLLRFDRLWDDHYANIVEVEHDQWSKRWRLPRPPAEGV